MSIKCENEWLRENSEEEMKKGDKYDHILSIRKIDLIVMNIDQCYKKEKNTLRVGNVNVVLKKGDEEIEQKEEDPESLCYFDRGNGQIESIDLESSEEEDHDDIVPTFLLHPNEIDENDTYPAFDPTTEHTQEEASQSSFPLLPFHSLLDSILNVYAQIFIGDNKIIAVSIHWRLDLISLNAFPSIHWRLNLVGRLCFFHKCISTIYKVSKGHIFRFVEQT